MDKDPKFEVEARDWCSEPQETGLGRLLIDMNASLIFLCHRTIRHFNAKYMHARFNQVLFARLVYTERPLSVSFLELIALREDEADGRGMVNVCSFTCLEEEKRVRKH